MEKELDVGFDGGHWYLPQDHISKNKEFRSILVYGSEKETIPQISIAIPTFRRSDMLKVALDSALQQEGVPDFEILVIDNDADVDPKTDALMCEYCREHGNIRYYRNEKNLGLFGNWNRCIELVRTEWYVMLHDDDALYPWYLRTVTPLLDASRFAVLAGFNDKLYTETVNGCEQTQETHSVIGKCASMLTDMRRKKLAPLTLDHFIHQIVVFLTPVIHREKALSLGGFDEDAYPLSDYVFWAKLCYHYGAVFLPKTIYQYRIGKNASLREDVVINQIQKGMAFTRALARTQGYSEADVEKLTLESGIIIAGWNEHYFASGMDIERIMQSCGIPKRCVGKRYRLRVKLRNRIAAMSYLFGSHI